MAPLKYNPMALSLLCHEPRCCDTKESNVWKNRPAWTGRVSCRSQCVSRCELRRPRL